MITARPLAVISLLTASLAAALMIPNAYRINPATDVKYFGAFRAPQGPSNGQFVALNQCGLAFNPSGGTHGWGSLYVYSKRNLAQNGSGPPNYVGATTNQVCEIDIPDLRGGITPNLDDLAVATYAQGYTDPTEGQFLPCLTSTGDNNAHFLGGMCVRGSSLYLGHYDEYDQSPAGCQLGFFRRPTTLSIRGQVVGPYHLRCPAITAVYPENIITEQAYTTYMTDIPSEWQDALGGSILVGGNPASVVQRASSGPVAAAWDADNFANNQTLTSLFHYPSPYAVGYPNHFFGPNPTSQNAIWNTTSKVTGIVFPTGTRTIMCMGSHGTGPWVYGNTDQINNPPNPALDKNGDPIAYDPIFAPRGPHAYPYFNYIWWYDANDCLAVVADPVAHPPWNVQPYAITTFTPLFCQKVVRNGITYNVPGNSGVAYDHVNRRVYVSMGEADGNRPVFNVFLLGGWSASDVPTTTTPLEALRVLQQQVAANADAEQSAVVVLGRLHQLLNDAIAQGDLARVRQVMDGLAASQRSLASAIVAYTP